MSPTPIQHAAEMEPGQMLHEMERRQDDVLTQLDELDARLSEVLRGLGVNLDEEIDSLS